MNKYIEQVKKVLKSSIVAQARLKLAEAGKVDVSPILIALGGLSLLGLLSIRTQLEIRPRLRLALGVILSLLALFQTSIAVVAYLAPREADIKINGKVVLVAQDQLGDNEAEVEISQAFAAKLSPFEFRTPLDGTLSQGYSRYHRANDIAAPLGSSVHPVGAGIIEFAGRVNDGKGNIVIIDHGDGLKSLYAHLGKIEVGLGNAVNTSTALGTVGLTGRTTGPHVHLEIYDHDQLVNPGSVLPDAEI